MPTIHDAPFDLPREPPIPFGSSPFRTKGIAYDALLAFIDARVPGGRNRLLERVGNPGLGRFLEQRFASSAWFDAVPIPYIATACADLRGTSLASQLRDSNRFAASSRFVTIYSGLLRVVSPQLVALALPRAASIVHDFGGATSHADGKRAVAGVRRGVPRVLVRWLALSTAAYLEKTLEDAGARSPRISWGALVESGIQSGQPLYDMPFRIEWDA